MLHRRLFVLGAAGLACAVAAAGLAGAPARAGEITAHDFAFPGIAGETVRLKDYAGKAVLVVNTASRCGFTNQYEGLQTLWTCYGARGLVVLGVPSDDFGGQELDSEAEVKEFCSVNFDVDFPMTAITPVTGGSAHPFYTWARRELGAQNAPKWNFHKYLVGPDGRLITAFGTGIEPTSREIVSTVERVLPQG